MIFAWYLEYLFSNQYFTYLEHALGRMISVIYFWIPQMLLIDLKNIEKIMEAFKKEGTAVDRLMKMNLQMLNV